MEVLAGMRAGHDRQLGRIQVELLDATGFDEGHQPERLDGRPERHDPFDVTDGTQHAAGRVDLDDVAAVHALLDAIAHLTDEDRGDDPGSRAGFARAGCRGGHGIDSVSCCEGARAYRGKGSTAGMMLGRAT